MVAVVVGAVVVDEVLLLVVLVDTLHRSVSE